MTKLADHPTVVNLQTRQRPAAATPAPLDGEWLRQLCLAAGAADVGFVEIERAALDDQRADILRAFPRTRTLISYVCRMNRAPIRSPARSVANGEFHAATDHTEEVGRAIVAALEAQGVQAINPSVGFPMEMDQFPGKTWVVSHKPVAVAAGLGQMGIHRNVIHPKLGNFILLGTILLDQTVSSRSQPLDYNPCLTCKLCVAACPVGAISADGSFNFAACYTHNYREFMGGFTDWAETLAESSNAAAYRRQVSDSESASMWQSLSFGANYKAAYCMAVCPAGEEVIAPFLADRKGFLEEVVKPLQQKVETIYVTPDSDAELHVLKRFPHKRIKRVQNGLRATSIAGFFQGLPLLFKKHRAAGQQLTYHFTFTGAEVATGAVVIKDGVLEVKSGHHGQADCHLIVDSATWLGFLRKEQNLLWAMIRGKVRIQGSPRLLLTFGRLFG